MRICDTIVRHETLGLVLEKADISDYYALQEKFRPGLLDFSDYDFTDDTRVILSDELLDDYERQKSEEFYRRWPLIISIIAIIISFLGSIGSDSLLGLFRRHYRKLHLHAEYYRSLHISLAEMSLQTVVLAFPEAFHRILNRK